MKTGGCDDGSTYGTGAAFGNISSVTRIGTSGTYKNGSQTTAISGNNMYLNAINLLFEHDNDGSGSNESQLYMANGGVLPVTESLGSKRTTYTDGGIVRTILAYSTKSQLPPNCSSAGSCMTYWEDVTPGANTNNVKWTSFVSIPYPQNSTVTGSVNCDSSLIEMDCTLPYNIFIPAMKAIPYMRTAPNGDLYMIRNACSTQSVCVNAEPIAGTVSITKDGNVATGSGTSFTTAVVVGDEITIDGQTRKVSSITNNTTLAVNSVWTADAAGVIAEVPRKVTGTAACDFRYHRQVCPSGFEVTQLWMMPKNCGTASQCADAWTLVAEYGSSGKTNMQGRNSTVGSGNTHITLLEFVGNYIYIGFDNSTSGANIWRADMSGIPSGSIPAESAFSMVNIPGLDGTTTNQKIFSHITVNDSGTDWLLLTTRDGTDALKIYRTANDKD